MGIDGRIFPVFAAPKKAASRKGEAKVFEEFLDHWYPIQVKQKDRVGRPDIDYMHPRSVKLARVLKNTGSLTTRTNIVQTAGKDQSWQVTNDGITKR